jgi:transposase
MWTKQSRGRMAKIAKKTMHYPSNLTDEEWERIALLMPKPGRRGRQREVDFREVINAVRNLARSGCGWPMLPVGQLAPKSPKALERGRSGANRQWIVAQ